MIRKIYSVYDNGVQAFLRVFEASQDGEAIREFTNIARNENTPVHNHPHDYTLFYIGQFDNHSGMLKPEKTPTRLLSAQEVLTPQEETH